jgi:AmmeMemoRadiSam system protein A
MEFSDRQRLALLDIARGVIRQTLAGKQAPWPQSHDLDFFQKAGCFVSIHEHGGKLRGCVGRLDASEPLVASLTSAAVSVLTDPRFRNDPITTAQLPHLELELSILSPLRPVENVLAFDPKEDGVYLTIGPRSGCFLPQVGRQTGWSREQLLARLCTEKLGMPATTWQQPSARLSVFTAIVVGPEPLEGARVPELAQ